MTRLDLSVAAVTHTGMVRGHNEDALIADGVVYAVADGMGGHEAGEVASAAVVRALSELNRRVVNGAVRPEDLVTALEAAQYDILALSSGGPRSAGSTVAGVVVVDHPQGPHWLVFNVGDSRVYRHLEGSLEQISVDHSLVQQMIDRGTLTAQEAHGAPGRNVITRALGAQDHEPALFLIPITDCERILVCTDGLTNELTDATIARVIDESDTSDAAAHRLLALALENGARDNVSLILVEVHHGGAVNPGATGAVVTESVFEDELDEDTQPRPRR